MHADVGVAAYQGVNSVGGIAWLSPRYGKHVSPEYRLVWAKKVTLAAICLDISSTSFGIGIN